MENNEKKKIVMTSEKKDYNLEEMLGPLRDMLKEKTEAAEAGKGTPGALKIVPHKEFQFQGEPGLVTLLKWLIKISPPPKSRAQGPTAAATPALEPKNRAEAGPALSGPEAIHPSSSGWIVGLTVIILAAFYFFYKTGFK